MNNTDGATDGVWAAGIAPQTFPRLPGDAQTDVCVIGAGITGLTTAYLLAREGKRVIVLSDGGLADTQTLRTSAHLSSAIDDRFSVVEKKVSPEAAAVQYASNDAAVTRIGQIAADEHIDCNYARVNGYLMPSTPNHLGELEKERDAAHRAGFTDVELVDDPGTRGFAGGPCLKFPRQGQFHAGKYLVGLAEACRRLNVTIHSDSRVSKTQGTQDGTPCLTHTAAGLTVRSAAVVVATNTPGPITDWQGIYTKQPSYRTYMVGLRVPAGAVEPALYWDDLDPYHYARVMTHDDGTEVLIVGGEDHEDHKVGHNPKADPF
ncbi:MAG: NAD(P)/FAD-dependent oxidoreductase, partial [Phycisphaerae bacterium]